MIKRLLAQGESIMQHCHRCTDGLYHQPAIVWNHKTLFFCRCTRCGRFLWYEAVSDWTWNTSGWLRALKILLGVVRNGILRSLRG